MLLGAQVEMFRSLKQLRDYAGLLDVPEHIDLGNRSLRRPSEFGLPSVLDTAEHAVVVFLSDKCATCRTIAASLDGGMPSHLYAVVDAGGADTSELVLSFRLEPSRTLIDSNRGVMNGLGLRITPVAITVHNGLVQGATTIPSTRQLYALLDSGGASRLNKELLSTKTSLAEGNS